MPFVHVELVEGRSDEQLKGMMADITAAVEKNTGAPREAIRLSLMKCALTVSWTAVLCVLKSNCVQ